MKQILEIIVRAALVITLLLLVPSAKSQVFSNPTVITNSQSAVLQLNFQPQVFSASVSIPAHSLMVTNVSTNTWIYLSYGSTVQGQSASTGGSNIVQSVTVSTNLNAANGWTNGSTWIFQIPAQSYTVPMNVWGTYYPSNTSGNGLPTNGVIWN